MLARGCLLGALMWTRLLRPVAAYPASGIEVAIQDPVPGGGFAPAGGSWGGGGGNAELQGLLMKVDLHLSFFEGRGADAVRAAPAQHQVT